MFFPLKIFNFKQTFLSSNILVIKFEDYFKRLSCSSNINLSFSLISSEVYTKSDKLTATSDLFADFCWCINELT